MLRRWSTCVQRSYSKGNGKDIQKTSDMRFSPKWLTPSPPPPPPGPCHREKKPIMCRLHIGHTLLNHLYVLKGEDRRYVVLLMYCVLSQHLLTKCIDLVAWRKQLFLPTVTKGFVSCVFSGQRYSVWKTHHFIWSTVIVLLCSSHLGFDKCDSYIDVDLFFYLSF